jgi:hypothetical protein
MMSPSPAPHSSHVYIECDIPDGMTLIEWRRGLNDQRVTSPLSRVRRWMARTVRPRQPEPASASSQIAGNLHRER